VLGGQSKSVGVVNLRRYQVVSITGICNLYTVLASEEFELGKSLGGLTFSTKNTFELDQSMNILKFHSSTGVGFRYVRSHYTLNYMTITRTGTLTANYGKNEIQTIEFNSVFY